MKDIPIIFSGPMVRALLEGRKTQTRRLAWATRMNPGGHIPDGGGGQMDFVEPHEERIGPSPWQKVKPGDRLWVRENWRVPGDFSFELSSTSTCTGPEDLEFAADFSGMDFDMRRWRPSIHLPRWASRLTLVVTGIKIEPLQTITEEDAQAEGARAADFATGRECILDPGMGSYRLHFQDIWIGLHGKESWDANPQVVALSFTVHQTNIDELKSFGPTENPQNERERR